jgi:hypothetical protein
METESVKSERSSKSHRSRNSGVVRNNQRHSHRSNHSSKSKRTEMAPFQTSVNLNEDSRDGHGQEVIEVQILPQDENWGTETHITGNTSEQSISMEDVNSNWATTNSGGSFACQKHVERIISLMLCMAAFCSPIAMALLPKIGFFPSTFQNEELNQLTKTQLLACNAECKGEKRFEGKQFLPAISSIIHGFFWATIKKSITEIPLFLFRLDCDPHNTSDSPGNWPMGALLSSTLRRHAKDLPLPLNRAALSRHINLLLLAVLHRSSDREHHASARGRH